MRFQRKRSPELRMIGHHSSAVTTVNTISSKRLSLNNVTVVFAHPHGQTFVSGRQKYHGQAARNLFEQLSRHKPGWFISLMAAKTAE
jgi:hypothetical protein